MKRKWTEGKLSLNHGIDMTEGRRLVENRVKERNNTSSYRGQRADLG